MTRRIVDMTPDQRDLHRAHARRATLKMNATRRDVVEQVKLDAGCADCGYREYACALQFDHVRGEKLFSISGNLTRQWGLVLAEIAKCDVVCANCHAVRTMKRGYPGSGNHKTIGAGRDSRTA